MRITTGWLNVILCATLGCGLQARRTEASSVDTTFTNVSGVATLANSKIELKWETTHGTLTGLKNLTTGTRFITGATKGNWMVFVDTSTASKWSTTLGTQYVGASGVTPTITSTNLSNGIRVDFTYSSVGSMNITLVQHVQVLDYSPVSTWTMDVTNNISGNGVVSALIAPQINGVGTLTSESLAYPFEDGEIIHSPGTMNIDVAYPMPLSMQWMALYNASEGLYYSVNDPNAVLKELRFGYDSAIDYSSDSSRIMASVLWPFVEPGTSYTTPSIEVAPYSEGGWWWGADRYRSFIQTSWLPVKHYSSQAQEMYSFGGAILTYAPPTNTDSYATTMPADLSPLASDDTIQNVIFGWHAGNFDSFYPDFAIDTYKGGETGMASGVATIHGQGQRLALYVNAWEADTGGAWWTASSGASDVKLNPSGGYPPANNLEPPSYTSPGRAESPIDKNFQDQLVSVVTTNRTTRKTDFGFFDQAMEASSYMDYVSSHFIYAPAGSVTSPATAYSVGYPQMFSRFHAAFNDSGLRNDYFFMAEGVNDYLSPYIDVGAMEWFDDIGYTPGDSYGNPGFHEPQTSGVTAVDAPGLTRYTVPIVELGVPIYQDSDAVGQYGWASTMGDPLHDFGGNTSAFPRLPNIYKSEPDIYAYGTYKDERGLSLSNAFLAGASIVGKNSDRIGIQIRNTTGTSASGTVTLDYSKIGLDGASVTGVVDLEGSAVTYTTGTNSVSFSTTVGGANVKAYKVSLSGGIVADTHYYTLTNLNSGLNLDVYLGSTADLAQVEQYTVNGGTAQRWQFHDVGNGFFELVPECSGKALDVYLGSTADGANIDQYTRNGYAPQQWRVERVAGGYRLTAKTGKVLGIVGASTSTLANAEQETWTGASSQIWTITQQSGTTPSLLPSGRTWMIMSRTADLAMDVYTNSTAANTPIEQYTPNTTSAQQWTITSLASGLYEIGVNGSYALSVSGNSTSAGAALVENSYTGACGQKFQITHIRDGLYTLVSSCNTALNVEVSPDSAEPLTYLKQDTAPASPAATPNNQLWRLVLQNP